VRFLGKLISLGVAYEQIISLPAEGRYRLSVQRNELIVLLVERPKIRPEHSHARNGCVPSEQ
jgi:hypothetical protein